MGQMIYRNANGAPPFILDSGMYRGIRYLIVSRHEYPCAYIEVGEEYAGIDCHGGVTYSGRGVPGFEGITKGTHWIGWDYAHGGDFTAFSRYGKTWTTEEMVAEARAAIDEVLDDDA